MKNIKYFKKIIFLTLLAFACSFSVNALFPISGVNDSFITQPTYYWDFEGIANGSNIAPAIGAVTLTLTGDDDEIIPSLEGFGNGFQTTDQTDYLDGTVTANGNTNATWTFLYRDEDLNNAGWNFCYGSGAGYAWSKTEGAEGLNVYEGESEATINYAGDYLELNTWNRIIIIRDVTNGQWRIYKNGTNTYNDSAISVVSLTYTNLMLNKNYNGNSGDTGTYDDFALWIGYALTEEEISLLTAEDATPPSIILDEPVNTTTYNNYTGIITVHIDEDGGNCSLNNTLWTYNAGNKTSFTFINNSALAEGLYSLNMSCWDAENNNASILFYFTIDNSMPVITMTYPLSDNTSALTNYGILNISFHISDNIDLYNMNTSITNGSVSRYNFSIALTGNNSYSFNETINISEWDNATYELNIRVCDSHTAKNIKEADNILIDDGIINFTFDDTFISIEAQYKNSVFTAEKRKDRYIFNALGKKEDKKQFYLKSNKNIDYLMHSKYKGHFVIGNYWVDFEPYDVIVYPINEYYMVEVAAAQAVLNFTSIGELNCIENIYQFTIDEIPPSAIYYSSEYFNNTRFFNIDALKTDTVSGVLLWFFILLILIGAVVFSEYLKIPAVMCLVGVLGMLYGFLLYGIISSIIGIFFIIIFFGYLIRGGIETQN